MEHNPKVEVHALNPKAVTIDQLYGFTDATLNWSDGILSKLIRELASEQSTDNKWILLDGPVDSLWIESMNTVMDQVVCIQLVG
jgi:dynein heavy chain